MAFNNKKNYYEILDVDTGATAVEIKSAYRRLARKYHPDVNNTQEAVEIFKNITIAYETLINEEQRKNYDIINGIFKEEKIKTSTFKESHETQNPYTQEKKQKVKKESKKASVRRNSIAKTLKYWFTRFKKNKRIKDFLKPKKGDNITTEINISPDEVITGSKRIVHIRTTKTCPLCMGHHFVNGDKCPKCLGTGHITESKKITVTIPKGIRHGSKLRLKGEGASGINGGPNGDVFIIVNIETKTQVYYDKLNIYYNVPITPYEAALGDEITIPAFDGTIKLKLPKNTCSGQKFRIAKQGIKKNGKVGDIIVTVSIEFSENLSEDEIRLYEQLKNLSQGNVRKNFGYGS